MEKRSRKLEAAHTALLAERWAWFAIGVIVNAFGIALITKAAFGTSPISSLPYVLSLRFPLTFGEFTFLVNMLFIIVQPILLGRAFRPLQWLQIAVNVAFSASIDASMLLLSWLDISAIPLQIASLAAGCVALGIGVSIEVAPNVLYVPGEGAVRAIAEATGRRFGSCKVAFDSTLVIIAVALSFAFFGHLSGIGIGTVVSALLVGTVSNFVHERFPLIAHIERANETCDRLSRVLKRRRLSLDRRAASHGSMRGAHSTAPTRA